MHEFPDLLPWEEMTAIVKRHEEQIAALQRVQAELFVALGQAQAYISGLETTCITMNQQIDALEKVVADLNAALPRPEKVIQGVQSDPHAMSCVWIDESGEGHIQWVQTDLFAQALERLTPEQRKMLAEAQEDDCIF